MRSTSTSSATAATRSSNSRSPCRKASRRPRARTRTKPGPAEPRPAGFHHSTARRHPVRLHSAATARARRTTMHPDITRPSGDPARTVLRMADIGFDAPAALLGRFGLHLQRVAAGEPIPGSFWGEEEAGIIGTTVYARDDTPAHSLLHEARSEERRVGKECGSRRAPYQSRDKEAERTVRRE